MITACHSNCTISGAALLFGLLLACSVDMCRAVTLKELCSSYQHKEDETNSNIVLMGRTYSTNVAVALDFFCHFADSPHSTDVETCESWVDTYVALDATIILRGQPSTIEVLKSYCKIHAVAMKRHLAVVTGIKELGRYVQIDMVQYAEVGDCYGIDDASLIVHIKEGDGKMVVDEYNFIAMHKDLYDCVIEAKTAAAAADDDDDDEAETKKETDTGEL